MITNRRTFIQQVGMGAVAAYLTPSLLACSSNDGSTAKSSEIGIQLYTLRDELAKDASATIAKVAKIGYNHVETFGVELVGNTPSFWGLPVKELQQLFDDHGLKTHSGHYHLSDFLNAEVATDDALKTYIDIATELGQQYIIAPVPPVSKIDQLTADDYKFIAQQLNLAGELCKGSGIQVGYHNHFWEFRTLDNGKRGLDILIEETDKDLVVFELDLFWTERSGIDSVTYFNNYPGRFPLWHLKDIDKSNQTPILGPEEDKLPYEEITQHITYSEVGSGSVDFHKIIAEKETAGLKYAFVEQDVITIDPFESAAKSYGYVKKELLK